MTNWTRKEAGSALLITTMVAVILTLLGLAYLTLSDQENSIALNQRDSDQLLYVGEAGARMVKAWFDRPTVGDPNVSSSILWKFMGTYDMRLASRYDRTKRLFDHDGDPNTPEVLADGTATKPYFRQGLPIGTGTTYLSFWDKPYRGSKESEFRGLESGPDIVMDSDTTSLDNLDLINRDVIGDLTTQLNLGRIQKIEVYAPPIMTINGVRTRYGICTVKITASKFKNMSTTGAAKIPILSAASVEVGRRVVKMVLNETPYPGPTGPFQSCNLFAIGGAALTIHWGEVSSLTPMTVPNPSAEAMIGPSIPWATTSSYITGATLTNWITAVGAGATTASFDPWLKYRSGSTILPLTGTATAIQPDPFVAGTPALASQHSNLFQFSPPQCPSFDYQIWKNVAQSGGQDIHYLTWNAGGSNWQEDGVGTGKSLQQWVNGQEGFWFFDTKDRLPPDPNGTNLTPASAVNISGGWSSAGFIYLNGHWDSAGSGSGANRVLIPPGEPWTDANGDKVAQADEYTNLRYPTSQGGAFAIYPAGNASAGQTASVTSTNGVTYAYTTDPNNRDAQGLPFTGQVHFQGVIFIAGTFNMSGNLSVFGSLVTKGGMPTTSTGSPDIYFDERLIKGQWPPPELNLPRTTVTFWQTEM